MHLEQMVPILFHKFFCRFVAFPLGRYWTQLSNNYLSSHELLKNITTICIRLRSQLVFMLKLKSRTDFCNVPYSYVSIVDNMETINTSDIFTMRVVINYYSCLYTALFRFNLYCCYFNNTQALYGIYFAIKIVLSTYVFYIGLFQHTVKVAPLF